MSYYWSRGLICHKPTLDSTIYLQMAVFLVEAKNTIFLTGNNETKSLPLFTHSSP
ncbi:hypothetical protein AQPE_4201 [Aquipluma nitroreducens]|uniref:Uncharacterized protein n=1 Tax=Aquipluma nitroreducens TaxID=2010828 RepID=A0A5K7SEK1_9BACT|nr:hypothetical protein AQPE_4201 [Aquipluma nitroreducens]